MQATQVTQCQMCATRFPESVFHVGWLPPVNTMREIGEPLPPEEVFYPTELLECQHCKLVQLSVEVDPEILFPKEYAYRSSTTKILKDNFKELFQEVDFLFPHLGKGDVIVDLGGNDGNLLSNFHQAGFYCINIEPTGAAEESKQQGIPTINKFFSSKVVDEIVNNIGKADVVTCTNCFAHMPNINEVVENIRRLMSDDGVFICENHYLPSLIENLQYDCLYHEHRRFYSLTSLKYLFDQHGLEITYVKKIPTHGGSLRVYAQKKEATYDHHKCPSQWMSLFDEEKAFFTEDVWTTFRQRVARAKMELFQLLAKHTMESGLYGVGAPSRAVTLVHFLGLDENILDCIVEVPQSPKLGHYLPGTRVPIYDQECIFEDDQPEYVLLLSWHIADELMKNLKKKGYRGKFIVPLPIPKIIE